QALTGHGRAHACARKLAKLPEKRQNFRRFGVHPGNSSYKGSAREGGPYMARQIVMDTTGDIRHEFDPADPAAVAEAERRFKGVTGAGVNPARGRREGGSGVIRSFESAAEETLFFPRLKAG